MASSTSKEIAVFTDTNLGTHIALAVSPDIKAGDFKRELERRHLSCFPKFGEIKVYGLLVKRKSSFYHLPNSVPIKHAFQGRKGTWFLLGEAKPLFDLDGSCLHQCMDANIRDHNLNTSTEKNDIISNGEAGRIKGACGTASVSKKLSRSESLSKRKGKKEKKVESAVACNSSPLVDIPGKRLLKAVVVADCVKRCSSNYSEVSRLGCPSSVDVTSMAIHNHLHKQLITERDNHYKQLITERDNHCTIIHVDALPKFAVKSPPRISSFPLPTKPRLGTSRKKPGGPEVGKCLVKASKNISISVCKTSPTISICRLKNKKLLHGSASSMAKYLAFEISDSDD
ncbi:hypothetical protein AB3S75_020328 [Citrus x aurantiifolia]